MRNKNGFTLVEIITTIVIIGILFAIAVPSYIMISTHMKEKSYQNKISYALSKAEAWASDTGRTVTNIAHLIEEGYMEPDNESGAYDNPIDRTSMLCYTIRIDYQNNHYRANLTEERFCNYEDLEKQTSIIELIKMDELGHIIEESAWSRSDNLLRVRFRNDEDRNKYQNSVTKIEWKGNGQVESYPIQGNFSTKNEYEVKASLVMNTRYEVTVTIVHEGQTFIYKAYTMVRIDRQMPIIYQDEISIDHFNDWTNDGKNVKIVTSDFDGSGVYGYYIHQKGNSCPSDQDSYTPLNGELIFQKKLVEGDYYSCVMDNVGNVSDASKLTIVKVDNHAPRLDKFIIKEYEKGITFYSKLILQIKVIDDESGPNALKYCITTNNDCNPNSIVKVDPEGNASTEFISSNPNPQKVCAVGIDNAGNVSEKVCSDLYLVDKTPPMIDSLEVQKSNHQYVSNFSAHDSESGIYKYQIYLGTSSNNLSLEEELITTDLSGSHSFPNLKPNTLYYLKLVVTNRSGLTAERMIIFTPVFTIEDAQYFCEIKNEYCDRGIYVLYSGHLFALYRAAGASTFGVNVGNDIEGSVITGTCCDQKHCKKESVYDLTFSGIYGNGTMGQYGTDELAYGGKTLTDYYNRFNNPVYYLNREIYRFGIVENINPKVWKILSLGLHQSNYQNENTLLARYGLLDLNEYKNIYMKSYMNGVGTLLSSVYPHCYIDQKNAIYQNPEDKGDNAYHHICNRNKKTIMAVYAEGETLTFVPAVAVVLYDSTTYRKAALTVPFKNSLRLTGGMGTREDPYTIE